MLVWEVFTAVRLMGNPFSWLSIIGGWSVLRKGSYSMTEGHFAIVCREANIRKAVFLQYFTVLLMVLVLHDSCIFRS